MAAQAPWWCCWKRDVTLQLSRVGLWILAAVAIAVGIDTRDDASVARALATVESELGPIGVLVNNAAVTSRGRFLERSAADFAAEIDVTVTGTLRISHAVAQRMAGTAVAASGIIAAILFFALHLPWYIFLLPALVGVLTGAWWGNDGGKDRRR